MNVSSRIPNPTGLRKISITQKTIYDKDMHSKYIYMKHAYSNNQNARVSSPVSRSGCRGSHFIFRKHTSEALCYYTSQLSCQRTCFKKKLLSTVAQAEVLRFTLWMNLGRWPSLGQESGGWHILIVWSRWCLLLDPKGVLLAEDPRGCCTPRTQKPQPPMVAPAHWDTESKPAGE